MLFSLIEKQEPPHKAHISHGIAREGIAHIESLVHLCSSSLPDLSLEAHGAAHGYFGLS